LFFVEGGTLAVENALKCAFDWKAQKLGMNEDEVNDLDVIHFKQAFHDAAGTVCP
jgi:L-lysine 6-transaminase